MIHLTACPLCRSEEIAKDFSTTDFSVSLEDFEIFRCENCGFLFTQNIPRENESGKYYQSEKYISHSDTSKGLVNRLYHFVRTFTLQQKRRLIEKLSGNKKGTILDIGSGTGSFLKTMQDAGWNISGIEPDETARHNSEKINNISVAGPESIHHLSQASFDVVTMWHVLEHVHRLQEQIAQIQRLLKTDGKVFIAVPNHTSYDAKHYGKYWAAWDVPRHLYHFSPATMKTLAGKHGFEITAYKPMWFDSFYVSMLSEKYQSGKSKLLKAFLTGIISNAKALINVQKCSSIIYILTKKSPQQNSGG